MMIDADELIAVDWGSTHRRAWRLRRDGTVGGRIADDQGVLARANGGFGGSAAGLRNQLGDAPLLMAGMIGSNRGWAETPYVDCPADLAGLRAAALWVEPGRSAIMPGVAQRPPRPVDVMRGEEVQALGAYAAQLVSANAVLCHPGTHSKWVRLESGRIVELMTMMTGELFALLAQHSILAPQLDRPAADDAAFAEGVGAALAGEAMLTTLFAERARAALHLPASDSASRVSGLLIGSDVRAAIARFGALPHGVAVIGAPGLAALYVRALAMAGISSSPVDAERAFCAGMAALAWAEQ